MSSFYLVTRDERDARALADEMKQMKHMKDSDLRITCVSLGKAIRSASNLGNGLPTGQPIEPLTGKMLSMDDGGSLRHKIVPSTRELFYAARCAGRERVGHVADLAKDDAELMTQVPNFIEGKKIPLRKNTMQTVANMMKRSQELEKQGIAESTEDRLRREYAHMRGHVRHAMFFCVLWQFVIDMIVCCVRFVSLGYPYSIPTDW